MRRIPTPKLTSDPGQTLTTDVDQQRVVDESFALYHRKRPIRGLKLNGLLSHKTPRAMGGSSPRRPSIIGVRAHARLVAGPHRRRRSTPTPRKPPNRTRRTDFLCCA